ncbi:MAG: hypothetical protein OEY19_09850 [Gammaproteobacteria bacterium]|nr:hypothetical protein [Gammaproteobacteria bacterium]MDH5630207.1 hypothetical protein [Gammaproteobacteria bacterium]
MDKHNWTTFYKGRMKLTGCSQCGEMQFPSNIEESCQLNDIFDSQLVKSGYRMFSESPIQTSHSFDDGLSVANF